MNHLNLSHLTNAQLLAERDAHWQSLSFWKDERTRLRKMVAKDETYLRVSTKTSPYYDLVRGSDVEHQFHSDASGWIERCRDGADLNFSVADRHVSYHARWVTAAVQEITRRVA